MAFDNQSGIMKVYECIREVHQDLEMKLPREGKTQGTELRLKKGQTRLEIRKGLFHQ